MPKPARCAVIGVYRDKWLPAKPLVTILGDPHVLITAARQSIRWQMGDRFGSDTARRCTTPREGDHDLRTAWHVGLPTTERGVFRCKDCGERLEVVRGCILEEHFEEKLDKLWRTK